MGHPTWPLYDLRLRTPDLELRLPADNDLVLLCQLARGGIHDPASMPFAVPWTDKASPQFEREFMQHSWLLRAQWSTNRWVLGLAVYLDGQPIGFQDVMSSDFPMLREVSTGSWLGRMFQGRGFGKQMRAAVLELAFGHLDAVAARSSAFVDNPSSLKVSTALGYEPNGMTRDVRRGEPIELRNMRLTRQRWHEHRFCEVTIEGLDSCRDMFGC